ncbi:MAG: ATP-binding protein [Thermodesulfobacteriota bacterium]|nr:ATP-binding protein [Thermodesulfobacteriota bacterium]
MAKRKRLLWQLYPSYLLITILSLVAATWFASRTFRQFFFEKNASDLEMRAHLFQAQIADYFSPPDEVAIHQLCKRAGNLGKTRITIILPSGRVIGDSFEDPEKMDTHLDRPEIIQAMAGEVGISIRFSNTLQKKMMYVGVPHKRGREIVGVVRTSVPLISIDQAISSIQAKIVFWGLLIALFAAILSLVVSRRISRPIEEIKMGAEAFARGEFQRRLPDSNSEEIGSLSEMMNQMALELHERINTIIRQRNELGAVLSSMMEGVIAVDMEERIISMNKSAGRMFGSNPSHAAHLSIQEVVRNTDLQQFIADTLSCHEPVEREIVLHSDGEMFINGHGTILRDAEGKQIGALIVLNDVTRLRKLENVRREFVANVSHEIKTPISAIKGFGETLRDGAIDNPDDARRFLSIIENHVDRLNAIVEDLLSLSRIEDDSERKDILLADSSLSEVLQASLHVCEARAASKGIQLQLSCVEEIVARINPPLLEQALVNLIDNAIKYSDSGRTINVDAARTEAEIVISVRDRGCGIGKEHLPRLFERFYRVDRARSRKLGGTGLGLAIVKHITQAHRGHIDVESIPGKGSIFSIHLPSV